MNPFIISLGANLATIPVIGYFMPDRSDSGRTVQDTSSNVSTSELAIPSRNSVARITIPARTTTSIDNTPAPIGYAVPTRPSPADRNTLVRPSNGGSDVVTDTNSPYYYDPNDILGNLSDLALKLFGGSQGISPVQQQAPSVIPVGSSGGGSNIGLMLLVLLGGGVAVWYFYFRK